MFDRVGGASSAFRTARDHRQYFVLFRRSTRTGRRDGHDRGRGAETTDMGRIRLLCLSLRPSAEAVKQPAAVLKSPVLNPAPSPP